MFHTAKKTSALSRLQIKLTLTYTLVTVAALLVLELLFLGAVFVMYLSTNNDRQQYIDDARYTLSSQAGRYLIPEQDLVQPGSMVSETLSTKPDLAGLQIWLDDVYENGYASPEPLNSLDSPAAKIVPESGLYVLDEQGKVLAASPKRLRTQVGDDYLNYDETFAANLWPAVQNQYGDSRYLYMIRGGNYLLAAPVGYHTQTAADGNTEEIRFAGVVVVSIEPAPPFYTLLPTLLAGLGVIAGTGLLLILAVAPFGALFGFVMARGLTRRLDDLTNAADAWSRGNFNVQIKDRSGDEIGVLSDRLRYMAEQVQNLMQTRRELAAFEERNRLARELHDAVKQQIFAVMMQLRAARNLLPAEPNAARSVLGEAEGLLKSTQQELSLLIGELRPAALEGQGLVQAIKILLSYWGKTSGINTNFQVQGDCSLPQASEQALYRVAQEALSNIARHSAASTVNIRLVCTSSQITLQISDNGIGFHPEQIAEGFGLNSMRQRMLEQGGSLTVESRKESEDELKGDPGTTVTAVLPLKAENR